MENKNITTFLQERNASALCTVLGFPIRDIETDFTNRWVVTYADGSKAPVDEKGVSALNGYRSLRVPTTPVSPKSFNTVQEVVALVNDIRSEYDLSVSMFDLSKELNGGRNHTIFANIKKGITSTFYPVMASNLQRMLLTYGYDSDLSSFERERQRRSSKDTPRPTRSTKVLKELPANCFPFEGGPCCPYTLYGDDYDETKYI